AKLLSITASIAAMLDGDLLEQGGSVGPGAYVQLQTAMRRARDANRRPDTYMKRVFAVVRAKSDPNVLLVAADPEESLQLAAHPGEPYRAGTAAAIQIDHAFVDDHLVTDEFGTFLRAWAPVRDHSGQIAGGVIVEAAAQRVELK